MSCRTETKEIDDREYSVTQWSAEKALLMKFKIGKIFGSSIATIAGAAASGKDDSEQIKAMSEGLESLFSQSSPEEIVSIMKSCIVGVALDGTRITETSFNQVFDADSLVTIYKVFVFVMQVNYGSLLKGQLAGGLLAKMTAPK